MDSVLLTMNHGQRIRCMSTDELAKFMMRLVAYGDDLNAILGTTCDHRFDLDDQNEPRLKMFKEWLGKNVLTPGCSTCSRANDCPNRSNDKVVAHGYCPIWEPKSLGSDDWVPCDLALPPTPGEYLVTTASGKCCVTQFRRSLAIGGAPYFSGDERIIAWRVLPDAYKGKEVTGDEEE